MQLNANIASYGDTGLKSLCDTSDQKVQEILLGCAYGANGMTPTEYFASVVMKDSFTHAHDYVDKATWALIDDEEQPCTVVLNHRSDGKTTRFAARVLRSIVLRLHPFTLYIQSTFSDATTEMDNVKTEMLSNEFIVNVFGRMKASSFAEVNKDFSKAAWFACNPDDASVPRSKRGEPFAFVLPRGAGQRVRGRNIYIDGKRVRPTLIIGDDLDDDEEVLSAENRAKTRSWWYNAVMKTPAQSKFPDPVTNRWKRPDGAPWNWRPPYRVFVAGTLVHHDCLVANLAARTDWKNAKFPLGVAEDQEDGSVKYVTKRPQRVSSAQLTSMAMNERAAGNLDGFYREMLCMPTAREHACWTANMFKYYSLEREKELQEDPNILRVIQVDPSRTAAQHSDLTGIIAYAIDIRSGAIYVRRTLAERLTTAQIPVRALQVAVETNSRIVSVEIIGQEGYVDVNFENAVIERGIQCQLIWMKQGSTPKGDYGTGNDAIKRWRAQQILPYYQEGEVWHHPDLKGGVMETMMKDYPRPTDWALTDCMGYIPAVMNEIGVRFNRQVTKHENVARFKDYFDAQKMDREISDRSWACV